MPYLSSRIQLFVDGLVRSAINFKQTIAGGSGGGKLKGASLPGGQEHLAAYPVEDTDGFPILKTGESHHSMWRTVEWQLLLAIVNDLPRPILDLGCGDGSFGALFTDKIEYGIDGDNDAVQQCNPAVFQKFFAGDLRETLAIPDGTLGAAFSNSVLEHVTPLEPAIVSVSRALKPGGKLVVTVPSAGLTKVVINAYGSPTADRLNNNLGHHNLWTWAQWEKLLLANGFSEVKLRGYLSHGAIEWYTSRALNPWPQIARKRGSWLWQRDLPTIKRYVRESLQVTEEAATTCVLIEATKGG